MPRPSKPTQAQLDALAAGRARRNTTGSVCASTDTSTRTITRREEERRVHQDLQRVTVELEQSKVRHAQAQDLTDVYAREAEESRKSAAYAQREHAVVQNALSAEKHRSHQYLVKLQNAHKRESRAKRSKCELQKKLKKLHNSHDALSEQFAQRNQELQELTATYSTLLAAHSATLGELDCLTRKSQLLVSERDLASSALAATSGDLDDTLLAYSKLVQHNDSLRLALSNSHNDHALLKADTILAQHAAALAYTERNYAISTSQQSEMRAIQAASNALQAECSASEARAELDSVQTDLDNARSAITKSKETTESAVAACEEAKRALNRSNAAQEKLRFGYQQAQKKLRALKTVKKCAPTLTKYVRDNIPQEATRCRKASKRKPPGAGREVYEDSQRELARSLVLVGCTQKSVGEVIALVGAAHGIKVDRKMSRRTVKRCITEGGIASKIQLGYEIRNTESITVSGDGTSNRGRNFEAQHLALKVPVTYADSDAVEKPTLRSLGVHSSANHCSETQLQGLKDNLYDIMDTYNRSPLAEQSGQLAMDEFTRKLCGMNSDHAADQKKLAGLLETWKQDTLLETLGSEAFFSRSSADQSALLAREHEALVIRSGGIATWSALPAAQKDAASIAMMRDLTRRLGSEAFNQLPSDERRKLTLFLWVGCCMHKELNAVKGANANMVAWWSSANIPGPVLLANKDNAATLAAVASSADAVTVAEQRAFDVSTAGAVKMTNLAGCLFNHKDDKKGLQDAHRDWFQRTFPDTSNTRYQSHLLACAEILAHLTEYIAFMEHIRDRKDARRFNHMEANVHKALHDIPTLTEGAALTLYGQAVSHPYVCEIRGPGTENTNILNLASAQERVIVHLDKLIDDPSILLAPDASFEKATLDGKEWQDPKAIDAIRKLMPTLPHLQPVLVACLIGARETWKRFTAEFAAGGKIDTATAAEKLKAWMPTTNDANEGALGALRLWLREFPCSGLHIYNAIAMMRRNKTQDFISAKLSDARSQQYLRKEARRVDSSNLEKKRRADLVRAEREAVELKHQRDAERLAAKMVKETHLASITLIFDSARLTKLKRDQLIEQLEKLRPEDKKIPVKTKLGKKAEVFKHLEDALARYRARQIEDISEPDSLLMNTDKSSSETVNDIEADMESDIDE